MALPRDVLEAAVSRVSRFCEERVPPEARSEVRLEHSVRGNAITIAERRPPSSALVGPEWTSAKIAQLRYDAAAGTWSLYCADRNERWWPYDFAEPSADLGELLSALADDPSGVFWG